MSSKNTKQIVPLIIYRKPQGQTSKDFWDITQSIATLLIPTSITLLGIIFSNSYKKAELELARSNNEIAQLEAKVEQAKLVSVFLDALVSDDPEKQGLAISAVLIALPDQGPSLVANVAQNTTIKN